MQASHCHECISDSLASQVLMEAHRPNKMHDHLLQLLMDTYVLCHSGADQSSPALPPAVIVFPSLLDATATQLCCAASSAAAG
jgi:hypothetical protein